jgi:hypothetical protein
MHVADHHCMYVCMHVWSIFKAYALTSTRVQLTRSARRVGASTAVGVLNAGNLVEYGKTEALLADPLSAISCQVDAFGPEVAAQIR